jgi:hypothetical protein
MKKRQVHSRFEMSTGIGIEIVVWWHHVALWVFTSVSGEVAASIFKFQVTSRKTETAGSFERFRGHTKRQQGVVTQKTNLCHAPCWQVSNVLCAWLTVNLVDDSNFFYQLDAQNIYYIPLHVSSTCADLQEDSCINTASGIVTVFGCLFSTQGTRGLVTCVLMSHSKTVTKPDAVLIQLISWRWAQQCSKHVEECNKCINPSAWGHLNRSSYCDVGRLFLRVI